RPGHPQDNGGHERMHLDLRFEVEDIAADNLEMQREVLEDWRQRFNHVRPHEALDMKVPASAYRRSTRRYHEPARPLYPPEFKVRRVNSTGVARFEGHRVYVGKPLVGYYVGLRHVGPKELQVQFYKVDLGRLTLPA
ncbi:MAG: transposase, partial [Gammaproteobacteria bacterium]|nr:transposase [Gammaproteobacteria bacterium]